MFFIALKAACVAVYGLALASLAGILPPGSAANFPWIALILLGVHLLELPLAYRYLRRYEGPFGVSVLLTLLFGLLHWKPLANAQARARNAPAGK